MKKIRLDNPEITDTVGYTLEATSPGDILLEVDGVFEVDDFILIEDIGHEYCEIRKITNVNATTITLSTPLELFHLKSIKITKLNYDKYKVFRTDDGEIYTEIYEGDLDYSNMYNLIEYIDTSIDGSDNLFYKVNYYNSETEVSSSDFLFNKDNNYGFITIDQYRADTTFDTSEVSDSDIEKAICVSLEWIQDNAFVYHEFDHNIDNTFLIDTPMEFADWNGDGLIDKRDIIVYEFNQSTLVKQYLNHKIAKIFPISKRIVFKESVPLNTDNVLVFKIPLTFKKIADIKNTLREISKLITTNALLRDVDISKIKNGITTWSAGGTNVNRDLSSLKTTIENNLKEAQRLLTQVCKVYIRKTKLRTFYSSLNYRQRSTDNYSQVSRRF